MTGTVHEFWSYGLMQDTDLDFTWLDDEPKEYRWFLLPHDAQWLPNGNLLLSSRDRVRRIDERRVERHKLTMEKSRIAELKAQVEDYLSNRLLPFWLDRCVDERRGGFITHFDEHGKDTGEDEKSLIAQSRTVYSMSAAHRAGFGGGRCAELAEHGVDFLISRMWDRRDGGFFWLLDRAGNVKIDRKILYGHSFAVYALSEYTLATGDRRGIDYAARAFDLIQSSCADPALGGYFEMFDRQWNLAGPGSQGGDRKTLDVHMHLMEAFSSLAECSGDPAHRQALRDVIDVLATKMLHPTCGTGLPQFTPDWQVAPQIKFDIVWGWDRFADGGQKPHAADNTSFGHNAELAWLLRRALDVLGEDRHARRGVLKKLLDHAVEHGIDWEFGGVFVEGPHGGGVHDREKEFWQQAEMMIGMLDGCLLFGPERFWPAYENVHRFVFDKVIHHEVGEWWPLLTREGEPIWRHMGHSWKVSYHTIRAMLECRRRLDKLLA